jgi:type II secretory pathway pseudopilin PulG
MTLLELVIASTMLAVLMTSIGVVMRTGRQAWEAHEADYTRLEGAHATLRHLVREVRQADDVSAITASTDNSGALALDMPGGDTKSWDHVGGSNQVNYGVNVVTPVEMLATEITGLRFSGFRADGTTPATTPAEVQCIKIDVTIQLPREVGGTRIVSSWAWVRSW